MKKVLLLVAVFVIAASVPAWSAYHVNWTSGFESPTYTAGELDPLPLGSLGQDRWINPDNPSYTTEVPMDVVAGAGIGGTAAAVERFVAGSTKVTAAWRDMRDKVSTGVSFVRGNVKFWVFDPGYDTTIGRVDARAGIVSQMGPSNSAYQATAQIQDATSRDQNFWYAQWASSVGKLDGVATVGGATGYSFVTGVAAPRVYNAWSYVQLTWNYTYTNPLHTTGSAVISWMINSTSPSLTLNLDSTSTRWNNFREIAGIYMGSGMSTTPSGRAAAFDNIEFHANAIPEPSGLLALGTGMVGLLGLIRRRK